MQVDKLVGNAVFDHQRCHSCERSIAHSPKYFLSQGIDFTTKMIDATSIAFVLNTPRNAYNPFSAFFLSYSRMKAV